MSLFGRMALLFIVVPILELVLLIQLGQVVGLLPTLALVITTGVVGAGLARIEGLKALWALQSELAQGRIPAQAIMDGLAILLGGAFLLTPGILTDILGFLLLLPPSRRAIQKRVRARLERGIREGAMRVTVIDTKLS
ncbi:MAG: FxsA family protein [Longimicrobiales bacterium]